MGKRGPVPKHTISTKWTSALAYAVGLITTDGNLSPIGGHVTFTTKDRQLAALFHTILGIKTKIGKKNSGSNQVKKYYVVQFKNRIFYNWLVDIGLTPKKSKTLEPLKIPNQYFFDFLRGHHDGDGSFYSYWDLRWRSSFMFYLVFISASRTHINWIRKNLKTRLGVTGYITISRGVCQLRYAKNEALKILKKMYHKKNNPCLKRKRLKIEKALRIVGEHL